MRLSPKKATFLVVVIVFMPFCMGGYWLMSHQQTTPSGIEGIVTYGPLCPVEPCSAKPTFNFDIIALRQNGTEAGRTRLDATGRYRLTLPSGAYQIKTSRTFASDFGGQRPEVEVAKGRFTHLDLSFDTGIR